MTEKVNPAYFAEEEEKIADSNENLENNDDNDNEDPKIVLEDAEASFLDIYKNHTTTSEKLLLIVSVIAAGIHGCMLPLLFVLFGKMTDEYTDGGQLKTCGYNCGICTATGVYNGTCDCLMPNDINNSEEVSD